MDEEYLMKVGMTKKQWDEAVEGFGSETVKTYSFTTDNDVTKQITLAGPNVMGAMCAYCHAGPTKLTNLYTVTSIKKQMSKIGICRHFGEVYEKDKEPDGLGREEDEGKG
jgi:hypothetical protein